MCHLNDVPILRDDSPTSRRATAIAIPHRSRRPLPTQRPSSAYHTRRPASRMLEPKEDSPSLLYPSSTALGEPVQSVAVIDDDGPQLVAEQTVADLDIPFQ